MFELVDLHVEVMSDDEYSRYTGFLAVATVLHRADADDESATRHILSGDEYWSWKQPLPLDDECRLAEDALQSLRPIIIDLPGIDDETYDHYARYAGRKEVAAL